MRFPVVAVFLVVCLGFHQPVRADDITNEVEAAKAAYGKGDQLHALSALQAAVGDLSLRLSGQMVKYLPPAPDGWETGATESPALDNVGGGLTVTRAYSKGEATLNAALVVDNPAVGASIAMFQPAAQTGAQPGWSRFKLGGDDVLLRFDPTTRAGEIIMIIGDRVLLQVEGNDIANSDVLLGIAKGWNTAGIRKFIGVGS